MLLQHLPVASSREFWFRVVYTKKIQSPKQKANARSTSLRVTIVFLRHYLSSPSVGYDCLFSKYSSNMLSSRLTSASRLATSSMRSMGKRTMASFADNKVEMSPMEKGKGHYINYQRIEDNLKIVRER